MSFSRPHRASRLLEGEGRRLGELERRLVVGLDVLAADLDDAVAVPGEVDETARRLAGGDVDPAPPGADKLYPVHPARLDGLLNPGPPVFAGPFQALVEEGFQVVIRLAGR